MIAKTSQGWRKDEIKYHTFSSNFLISDTGDTAHADWVGRLQT